MIVKPRVAEYIQAIDIIGKQKSIIMSVISGITDITSRFYWIAQKITEFIRETNSLESFKLINYSSPLVSGT